MNIGRLSVTRPVAVTMRIAALVLLGFICLLRIPIDLLPRIDIPTVAVSVSWPNTAPEEMETAIARPIEQAVSGVKGLERVSSTSSLGSTFVRVQLAYGTDVDQASVDVLQAVQRAKGRFPSDDNITEPQVFKFDPSSLPILIYGVSSDRMDLTKLRARLINEIAPGVEAAGGVAAVNVTGGQDRAIIVDADPDRLRALGLSLADLSTRIGQENVSLPAGVAREGNTQFTIRASGYFKSIDEIRDLPVTVRNGAIVRLREVADVKDASSDVLQYTRMNGVPSLNIGITKGLDANTVDVAKAVEKALAEVRERNPDLTIRKVYDQARFVERSITDLEETALIGGALAILIIAFFLRSVRSTLVVALSIPISIISTFSLLYFCGFTLNTISLSGLALASGLIVDDAIVVLEAIYRKIERGSRTVAEAAVEGTQEILSAVVASTFTVMIVFVPLLLVQGQAGQTFTQFALVVIFSIGISLLDALTVVPMLASRVIRRQDVPEIAEREFPNRNRNIVTRAFDKFGHKLDGLDHSYRRGLEKVIHRRWPLMLLALGSVGAAALLWPSVGREQLPPTDTGNLSVRVRLPVGTALGITNETMKKVEETILKDKDVDVVIAGAGANVGLRGSGGAPSNEGSATVALKEDRDSKTTEVVKRLQRALGGTPGARIQVQAQDVVAQTLFGANGGFGVDIYGSDLDALTAKAREVQAAMADIPGLNNADVNVQDATPELRWTIDRAKAQSLGVTFQQAADALAAATGGRLSTYYQEEGFQYPILVQIPRDQRATAEQIRQIPVNSGPRPVLLGQIATATTDLGPNQINRQNRQRVVSVGGQVQDRPESEVQADVEKALAKIEFEQGQYWTLGQQQLQRDKDYSGLGLAVFLAIALVYMLLATQFESFVYPLVVLVSVPLCAIGLVLALFLTGRSFGLTAFIGLLMLVGIVVKNGILLVDYTNQLRREGRSRDDAILEAGPTRLRPILMTTLAAILGMAPLAIGIGSGSEIYVPLATAVIGGLITSTMLTLFVVPVVYTLFDDLLRRFGKGGETVEGDLQPPAGVERTPASV